MSAQAKTHDWFASALLRYEYERGHIELDSRERLRLIAKAGVNSKWSKNWQSTVRLSTGLKNRQNVPAITLYRFTDQPMPDKDIFFDQYFVTRTTENAKLAIGKMPWASRQVTDTFWDRDLNPFGATIDYQISQNDSVFFGYYLPLDGNSDTVGKLLLLQYQKEWKSGDLSFGFMPWIVQYQGEEGARFAVRDTAVDNDFVYLTGFVKFDKWRLGADLGKSFDIDSTFVEPEYSNQKSSYAIELRHGGLRNINDTLIQFRLFRTERYAVITEFSQNAVSRFSTSNQKGWDFRVRRLFRDNLWIGLRYADSETLMGEKETGRRFRIEVNMKF